MALTRKLLEGMGIEDKQIETIIEAHAETVNGLKAERDKYKEQAEQVPDLQKKLEEAQAAATGDEWQSKYDDEHKAFEEYKEAIAAEKAAATKAQAYRGMLGKAGIDPRRIDAIMRVTDLSGVEMDGEALKDAEQLEEAAKKEWSDFVVRTVTPPTAVDNPPKGGAPVDGADPEVTKRMQARHERLYGKSNEQE